MNPSAPFQDMDMMDPVREVLLQGPVPEKVATTNRLKQFCLSKLGVALIATCVFFMILLLLQPQYIFQVGVDQHEPKKMNYTVTIGISIVGGVLVYLLPLFAGK
jgi:hypothetical protein